MAAGGAKKLKRAAEAIAKFQDPQATKIQEWQWRPLAEVNKQLNLAEVPDYIQRGYGDFMIEQGKRSIALDVVDWMYLTPDGTIMNRSQFRKFGIKVAELVATLRPKE